MSNDVRLRLPPVAEMEAAYQRRDASYDGVFYLGVRTTGVFCRPSADLDEVAMTHGFESHSGFRDAFTRLLGRSPGRSDSVDCVTVSWLESPVGPLVAGATDQGVCLLEFSDRRMLEAQLKSVQHRLGPVLPGTHPLLEQLRSELGEYFEGRRREFTVPLVYPGTPFQVKVWDALQRIPYGETYSYEKLAWSVAAPRAQRAVGHANGLNRVAIVIPCHRVVNKDGKLGGYGGGLWRKQLLLDLERGEQTALSLSSRQAHAAP